MSITDQSRIQYLLEMNVSGATSRWVLGVSAMGVGTILTDLPSGGIVLGAVGSATANGLLSAQINRGRSDEFSMMSSGTMTLTLDNGNGWFSPNYASSPYYPNFLPNRQVRLSARYAPGRPWTPLYFGYLETITPQDNGPVDGNVVITASDWLARAANAGIGGTRAQETDVSRFVGLTQMIGNDNLPTAYIGSAANADTILATTYVAPAGGGGGNGLSSLSDLCDATRATIYQARDGTLTYRSRFGRWTTPGQFVGNGWFFDQPGLNPDPRVVAFVDPFTYSYDIRTVFTQVAVQASGTGEAVQTANDATAQQAWGLRTKSIASALLADRCAGCYADSLLEAYRTPLPRVTAITVDTDASPITNPWIDDLLGLELGDSVSIIKRQPANLGIARAMFVEGIAHAIDGQTGKHVVTLQTSDQALFGPRPWIVGQSILGSTTVLAY
jgi:hypothetical protein